MVILFSSLRDRIVRGVLTQKGIGEVEIEKRQTVDYEDVSFGRKRGGV